MLKVRLLDTCSYFSFGAEKEWYLRKMGVSDISDLIALKIKRTKLHFSVSSNVLAENESNFHILLAF